jgi:hypothetical protein
MNPLLRLRRIRPTDRLSDYPGPSTASRSVEREQAVVTAGLPGLGTSRGRPAAVIRSPAAEGARPAR